MIDVFIINLPQSTERKAFVKAQCESVGISPVFIDAINGKNLSEAEISQYCDQATAKKLFGRELLLGEIGCALSHKKIYQKMIDENIHSAVILEDDAYTEDNFVKLVSEIHKSSVNWDLVLLGHYRQCVNGVEIISPLSFWSKHYLSSTFKLCRLVDFGYGTHGYLITNEGAGKLLRALDQIYQPIDHYTVDSNVVNVYALDPTVVKVQQRFETLIDYNNYRSDYKLPIIHRLLDSVFLLNLVRKVNNIRKKALPIRKYK